MRALVAVLVAVLIFLAAGLALGAEPKLPYAKFSEAAQKGESLGASQGLCRAGGETHEIFAAAFAKPDAPDYFVFFFAPENGRIVVAHFPTRTAEKPDYIGTGIVKPDRHDDFPPLRWVPYQEGTGPCQALFPETA